MRLWKTQAICARIEISIKDRTWGIGGKRLGLADYEQSTAKKHTKREKFLAEMETGVPWRARGDVIEPY